MSAALIPIYTERLHEDETQAKLLVRRVVTLLIIILGGLTLGGIGLAWCYWWLSSGMFETLVSVRLATLMLPYAILICLVAVLGGVLNVHRHFAAPAAAPIVLNVFMITGVGVGAWLFADDRWLGLYAVAVAVLAAGFVQLFLQWWFLRREGVSLKPCFDFRDSQLRAIMRMMGPMIIGLSAMQLNAMLDSVIARFLSQTISSGPSFTLWGHVINYPVAAGSVSALYFAQRLYQFPLGVFGIALSTAIFPHLSTSAVKGDKESFAHALNQGIRFVIFIGLPATIGMVAVRGPLTAIFVGHKFTAADAERTSWTLLFYALGIGAYCLQHVVVRGFYAFKDSITPVRLAVRIIALNLILNLILIWPLGTGGLALSTAICATIQVAVLLFILVRRHALEISGGILTGFFKTAIASAIMGLDCWLVINILSEYAAWLQLLGAMATASVLFAGVSLLLKNSELRELIAR